MEELNQKRIDRAVLVGLNADCFPKEETATETTLDELEALLNTAGGECAGKILQNKHTPDPRSFIGEGKAEEVRQLVLSTGANMVIFDNDLTPSQTRTLEDILKTTVLDRSALILDIFAQRAKTREGKLQVELAQYQYYLPRLTVWNEEMGRLGGGIGTRARARRSSRPTSATSAHASRSCAKIWKTCARSAPSSAEDGRKTICPSSPSWATRTRANRHCSTA